jgi:hypothetical protein
MPKFKAVNPRGYDCVNVLVQRAVGKVMTKVKNKDRMLAKARADPQANRDHSRLWRLKNPEKKVAADKVYYEKNRSRRLVQMAEYEMANHDELLIRSNKRQRERRVEDVSFAIGGRLRARLQTFLGPTAPKAGNTYDLIGCSPRDLQDHLERQTSFDIRDGEIDHIFAMTQYNLEVAEQQFKAMHFSNVQPLTAKENRNKSNKLPTKAMAAKVDPACWPDGITMDMLPDIYPGWRTPLRM